MSWRDARTATPAKSIWHDIAEETFREHLVKLEQQTNAVPLDIQTFPIKLWSREFDFSEYRDNVLPFEIEQQIADDFAFLAALEEGAQSVAAACLEQHVEPPGLTIRFAALDMFLNETTKSGLRDIASILAQAADTRQDRELETVQHLFSRALQLHHPRLLARLRSGKWQKPKHLSKSHKQPLWKDFANLAHRTQHVYTKREAPIKRLAESLVQELGLVYQVFETVSPSSEAEMSSMGQLVRRSFEFCINESIRDYARRLQDNVGHKMTKQVASAIKCLRQVEKIAAYWRVSVFLVRTAKEHPTLFRKGVKMAYLTPYTSVPTTIAYETWAKTCHVHAEVQLAVHYDLLHKPEHSATLLVHDEGQDRTVFHRPRAIGTSKYLCYLCYQFLRAHKSFFPANTHGRLYDQWTIPDLTKFDEETCLRYRNIVKAMDDEVERATGVTFNMNLDDLSSTQWRPEPMTSRQNLLDMNIEQLRLDRFTDRTSENGPITGTIPDVDLGFK